jgi:hypothetical protein
LFAYYFLGRHPSREAGQDILARGRTQQGDAPTLVPNALRWLQSILPDKYAQLRIYNTAFFANKSGYTIRSLASVNPMDKVFPELKTPYLLAHKNIL